MTEELLTSSLMKYLRVKSFCESRKVLLRNCLLSLPFFHSVASNSSGVSNSSKEVKQINCRLDFDGKTNAGLSMFC